MEFAKAVRSLARCESLVGKPWAIENDIENGSEFFKGVILGGSDTPIWGSVIHFHLRLDPEKLSEPPKIWFAQGTFHPFVDPAFGVFCYPATAYSLSSRMDMEKFLDALVYLFLMKEPFTHSVNMDAAKSFWSSPEKFWAVVRHQADTLLEDSVRESV